MVPEIDTSMPATGPERPLALWMALVFDAIVVAALVVVYLMVDRPAADARVGAPIGALAVGMTVLLAGAVAAAWRARGAGVERTKRWMAVGAFCAFLFVVLKLSEYRILFASGIAPFENPFAGVHTTLTGLQLLHVIAGAATNAWIIASISGGLERADGRVRTLSIYWVAVLLFWVVLLLMFY